jgi:hypothetical protein
MFSLNSATTMLDMSQLIVLYNHWAVPGMAGVEMTASSYVNMELFPLITVTLLELRLGLKSLAMVIFFPMIVCRLALSSAGVSFCLSRTFPWHFCLSRTFPWQ